VISDQSTLNDLAMASKRLATLTVVFNENVKRLDFSPLATLSLKSATFFGVISAINLKKLKKYALLVCFRLCLCLYFYVFFFCL
jgi:hypothetical protein